MTHLPMNVFIALKGSHFWFFIIVNKLLNNLLKVLDINDASDIMKTVDVTKNVNEKLRLYLSVKEMNGLFCSFTFNNY